MRKGSDAEALTAEIVSAVSFLRALALWLSGDRSRADDLVQETLEKALASLSSFTATTNLKAWLAGILRSSYLTDYRMRRSEIPDPDGAVAAQIALADPRSSCLDLRNVENALQKLSPEQREALMLVRAEGLSYEEAAKICGCTVGTSKSRVSRGEHLLAKLSGLEEGRSGDVKGPAHQKQRGRAIRKRKNPRQTAASTGRDPSNEQDPGTTADVHREGKRRKKPRSREGTRPEA